MIKYDETAINLPINNNHLIVLDVYIDETKEI